MEWPLEEVAVDVPIEGREAAEAIDGCSRTESGAKGETTSKVEVDDWA